MGLNNSSQENNNNDHNNIVVMLTNKMKLSVIIHMPKCA